MPNAADVNHGIDAIVGNNVVARLSSNGSLCIFTYGVAHVVIDVTGALK